ncbi:MAG: GerMN domain-containing protein [Actinobacteria bacterium]|nr:GerMN domain-containing protein [Actinomycetota bacterium]
MRRRIGAILALLILVTVACSVVDDGKVQRVNPPDELTDTLPTSTTAVTTTTQLATSTSGQETTTTLFTVPVRLFFIAGTRLNSVPSQLPSQFVPRQLLFQLQDGPPQGQVGAGLRTAIPPTPEITATLDGSGVAHVVLPDSFFDLMLPGDQRLAIAQIVLTLLTNIAGVGQVVFNRQVSGPAGELIAEGDQLTSADYQGLLASSTTEVDPIATPSQTTTTVTTTTVGG